MLPEQFVIRTKHILKDDWPLLQESLNTPPPVSVRVNNKTPLCYDSSVPWCESGYYLPERPSFTFDPLFHAGAYYVQEASSMFVQQALLQHVRRDAVMLDLCAAPGGKSTLLSQYLGNEGLLVSNEIIRQRAHVLSENIQKWGNGNALVTNNKPSDFSCLTHLFDAILVDAPCSGEGMFRKDPNSINEWSVANVELCAARQREILEDVWQSLKPNGILIYSTCTYNTEENEDNVAWIMQELEAEYLPLEVHEDWNITETNLGYHFYPYKTQGEGFFLAVLRKKAAPISELKPKKNDFLKTIKCPSDVESWIEEPEKFTFVSIDNQCNMISNRYVDEIKLINARLNCILLGTEVFITKGKSLIPCHGLALSKALNRKKMTIFEANYETAEAYLRTDVLYLSDLPLGYILITYQHIPIGWVKNVGNRCNNLYPNEWRIRKR